MSGDTELSTYYPESSKQTENAWPLLPERVSVTPINFTLAVSFKCTLVVGILQYLLQTASIFKLYLNSIKYSLADSPRRFY